MKRQTLCGKSEDNPGSKTHNTFHQTDNKFDTIIGWTAWGYGQSRERRNEAMFSQFHTLANLLNPSWAPLLLADSAAQCSSRCLNACALS